MEKRQAEILAPAGSWASMKAAVAAGADAVYMGGTRFGARAYADNPDEKGLLEAIDYVHLHGRRLYMTVNTLFKESELKELVEYMTPYYEQGLDGVIVQDLGALRIMKENFPGLELHASTQMTITSVYGARMLKDYGCSRVVTSREMSLDEIRRVHQEVDVEIESFVHGALCYCYSGQCLMSSLIGGRSGNRGRCAQPCRLPYRVYEGQAGQGKSPAINRENEKYVLSLKDLCTLDILPDILEAGVYSLKIEGRMKSPRYTAGVVSIYRKYVDRYLTQGREGWHVEPDDRKMLLDLFDRGGFTSGYYEEHNGRDMVALKEKPEFREGNQKLFDYLDRTYVEAELKEPVRGHVILETGKPSVMTLSCSGAEVTVKGQAPQAAQKQPMTEEKVLKQLNKTGNTPFIFEDLSAELKGEMFLPVQALNELRRSGLEALESAMLKPYRVGRVLEDGGDMAQPVMPDDMGAIQTAQPSAAAQTAQSSATVQSAQPSAAPASRHPAVPFTLTVSVEEPCQLEPVLRQKDVSAVYLDADGFAPSSWKDIADRCHAAGKTCYLALPHIFRDHALKFFKDSQSLLENAGFDGVLVRALEEIQWLEDNRISLPFITDASVYAWNSGTLEELASKNPLAVTMPWELNSREMGPVVLACSKADIPGELVVYGHAPMMVSAQCITRTVKSCTHKRGLLMLKDRTGAMLPVKNHCRFCYNTIYNPSPVSLLGSEDLIRRMGLARIRLQLTVEDAQQTGKVLEAFSSSFLRGEMKEPPFKDFTRGHFKRGVE
ncbi:U32 family peptidase [Enterocloster sp. OA13]|uniref:U32 family peptidase n=1 Tax=Enterocloster sp. OA13 TaxID=2914161 RepID=UPI001F0610F8|nr:U32 family peptidase [Enterocloster sp. OA13]